MSRSCSPGPTIALACVKWNVRSSQSNSTLSALESMSPNRDTSTSLPAYAPMGSIASRKGRRTPLSSARETPKTKTAKNNSFEIRRLGRPNCTTNPRLEGLFSRDHPSTTNPCRSPEPAFPTGARADHSASRVTVRNRSTGRSSRTCSFPSGHRTSRRSRRCAGPKPKCRRRSFCER